MGRICGQGEFEKQPFLLFFDLTKCLNPAVLSLGCPTPQVCVEECPKNTKPFYHNPSAKIFLKPFCQPMPDGEFRSKSADQLILEKLCPPWVLESGPVLGRW